MGKKSVSLAQKWQIVGLKSSNSHSNREIARLVGISEKCVRTTLINHKKSGDVKGYHASGRPSKTSDRDERWIFRKARENPYLNYRDLASEFNSRSS